MKRRWMMVFVVLLVALLLCACGRQESPVEDFEYEMVDGEVTITGYKGTDREIIIPAKIADRAVTRIGEYAFEGYDMVSVEFPDSLKEIGEGAFYRCKCLAAVTIPESVEVIGAGAFYSCHELSELILSEDTISIGESAFGNCKNLGDNEERVDQLKKTIQRWYSPSGEIESEQTTVYTYEYDRNGKCVGVIGKNDDGSEIKDVLSYDDQGNIVSVVSGEGDAEVVTTYTFDKQGNVLETARKYADRKTVTTYTYDEDGRLMRYTNSVDGEVEATYEWVYDKWDVVRINHSGNSYEECKYDWKGQVIESVIYSYGAKRGMYEYTYDEAGRQISTYYTNSFGETTYVIEYHYE